MPGNSGYNPQKVTHAFSTHFVTLRNQIHSYYCSQNLAIFKLSEINRHCRIPHWFRLGITHQERMQKNLKNLSVFRFLNGP